MKKILLNIFFFISYCIHSQSVVIQGIISGMPERHVVLIAYNGVDEFPVDSVKIGMPSGFFLLRTTIPYKGLYKLLVEKGQNRNPDKYIDLILKPGDEVHCTTFYPHITDSLKITKGEEQVYFARFTKQFNHTQYKILLLEDLLTKYPANDPFTNEIYKNLTRLRAEKKEVFGRFQNPKYELANRYISMLRQWDSRGDDFSKGFYHNIDTEDTLWVRNVLLHQKIGQYYTYVMNTHSAADFQAANKTFIDDILNPIKPNAVLWKNIFQYLVHAYKSMNYPDALEYLKSKYLSDGICADPSQATDIDQILQSLHAIKPGDKLPPVVLRAPNGDDRIFPSDLPSGKAGLLIVWSSGCSHCRESMPYWTDLYNRYKLKGLTITTLHLESDPSLWKQQLSGMPSDWANLHDKDGWNGYAATLKVFGTPVYVLYDAHTSMLLKTYDLSEVEDLLKKIL